MDFDRLIADIEEVVRSFRAPVVTAMSRRERDPFAVLVATLLSLRTRDEQTGPAAQRLLALAPRPAAMVGLPPERIEKEIFPVGFYRVKAQRLIEVSRILLDRYGGEVPSDMDQLLGLPGVGRKTANLVRTQGFGLPGICVDTHVHRISNRLGLVSRRTPEQTEMRLREILPQRYWIVYNDLLVAYGRNVCTPLSPRCSECRLSDRCRKVGVTRRR